MASPGWRPQARLASRSLGRRLAFSQLVQQTPMDCLTRRSWREAKGADRKRGKGLGGQKGALTSKKGEKNGPGRQTNYIVLKNGP